MAHPNKRKKANGGKKMSQVKRVLTYEYLQREIEETLELLRMEKLMRGAYALSMRDPQD